MECRWFQCPRLMLSAQHRISVQLLEKALHADEPASDNLSFRRRSFVLVLCFAWRRCR